MTDRALTVSAIAVSLGSTVLGAYLAYERIGQRWAYLAAMLVLAGGWILQRYTGDRRAVQTSILLAGLVLFVAMLAKVAQHGGWAPGADLDRRLIGVLIGAIVIALSNAIPKMAGSARALATRRIVGWSLVLGGLGYALAWLALPVATASDVAIAVLGIGVLVGIGAYARCRLAASPDR